MIIGIVQHKSEDIKNSLGHIFDRSIVEVDLQITKICWNKFLFFGPVFTNKTRQGNKPQHSSETIDLLICGTTFMDLCDDFRISVALLELWAPVLPNCCGC